MSERLSRRKLCQLGGKSTKYLSRIRVADTVKNIGKGLGSSSPEAGFSWYAGI